MMTNSFEALTWQNQVSFLDTIYWFAYGLPPIVGSSRDHSGEERWAIMAERKQLLMDEGVKVELPNTRLQLKMIWTCLLSILTDGSINNASIKYPMTDIVDM